MKKYPKTIKVKFKERIVPNSSCGTGYDEPSIYEIILDTGKSISVTLHDWYRPYESTSKEIRRICYEEVPVMNPADTFDMFLTCWKEQLGIKL